jgi:hypothetical protein
LFIKDFYQSNPGTFPGNINANNSSSNFQMASNVNQFGGQGNWWPQPTGYEWWNAYYNPGAAGANGLPTLPSPYDIPFQDDKR